MPSLFTRVVSSKSPCIRRTAGKHLFWPLCLNMFIQHFSSSAICQNTTIESRVFVDEGCNLLTGTRDICGAKFKGKSERKNSPQGHKRNLAVAPGEKVGRSLTSEGFILRENDNQQLRYDRFNVSLSFKERRKQGDRRYSLHPDSWKRFWGYLQNRYSRFMEQIVTCFNI